MDQRLSNINNHRPIGQGRREGNTPAAGGSQRASRPPPPRPGIPVSTVNPSLRRANSPVKPRSFLTPQLLSRVPHSTLVSQTTQSATAASRPVANTGSNGTNSSDFLRNPFPRPRSGTPSKLGIGNPASSTSSQAMNYTVPTPLTNVITKRVASGSKGNQAAPGNNMPQLGTSKLIPSRSAASTPQAFRYHELTAKSLNYLLTVPEPQRCHAWMKIMFVVKADGEFKQVDLWKLYEDTFSPYKHQSKLMKATELINNVSFVFPTADPVVTSGQYLVRGIERRREPILGPTPNFSSVAARSLRMDRDVIEVSPSFNNPRYSRMHLPDSDTGLEVYDVNGVEGRSASRSSDHGSLYGSTSSKGAVNVASSSLSVKATGYSRQDTPIIADNVGVPPHLSAPFAATKLNSNHAAFNDNRVPTPSEATESSGTGFEERIATRVVQLIQEQAAEKVQSNISGFSDPAEIGSTLNGMDKGKERAMDVDQKEPDEAEDEVVGPVEEEDMGDKAILEILKVLTERVSDIGRDVKSIGEDVGVLKGVLGILDKSDLDGASAFPHIKRSSSETEEILPVHRGRSILDRLNSIEMDVQEWLERARDPTVEMEEELQSEQQVPDDQDRTIIDVDAEPEGYETLDLAQSEMPLLSEPVTSFADVHVRNPGHHTTSVHTNIPSPVLRREIGTSPIRTLIIPTSPPPHLNVPPPKPIPRGAKVDIGIGTTPPETQSQSIVIPTPIPIGAIPIGLNISPQRANSSLKEIEMEGGPRPFGSQQGRWRRRLPIIRGYEGDVVEVDNVEQQSGISSPAVGGTETWIDERMDVDVVTPLVEKQSEGIEIDAGIEPERNASRAGSVSSLSSLTSSGPEGNSEKEEEEDPNGVLSSASDEEPGEGGHEGEDQYGLQGSLEEQEPNPKLKSVIDSDDEPLEKEDIFGPNLSNLASFPSSTPAHSNASWSAEKMKRSLVGNSPPPGQGNTGASDLSNKGHRLDDDEDLCMADAEDIGVLHGSSRIRSLVKSRKGKEKATQQVSDVETESAWPAEFRKSAIPVHSTPRSSVHISNRRQGKAKADRSGNKIPTGSGRRRAGAPPSTSTCISNASSSGSFSPVDWTKMKNGQEIQMLKLTSNATLLLKPGGSSGSNSNEVVRSSNAEHTSLSAPAGSIGKLHTNGILSSPSRQSVISPQAMTPSRSYTLPPPPEGSIAALRQETQGLAYPNSYVFGTIGKTNGHDEEPVGMVIGADAGERMLSPESQNSEEDDDGEHHVDRRDDKKRPEENDIEAEESHMEVLVEDVDQATEGRGAEDLTVISAPQVGSDLVSRNSPGVNTMHKEGTVSTTFAKPASSSIRSSGSATPSSPRLSSVLISQSASNSSSASSASNIAETVLDSETVGSAPIPKVDQCDLLPQSQSTAGTIEDEAQVQSLILDAISPATSPLKPSVRVALRVMATDADMQIDLIPNSDNQERLPTQDVPTPKTIPSRPPINASISYSVLPALSSSEVEIDSNLGVDQNPDEDVRESTLSPSTAKISSARISVSKPKEGPKITASADIIVISSDEETEVKHAKSRGRPRKHKKIHVFDNPAEEVKIKQEPIIIDITASPLPASAPIIEESNSRDVSPLTPLPSPFTSVSGLVASEVAAETARDQNFAHDTELLPQPTFDVKRHAARLDDDDAEVIHVKAKKRQASKTGSVSVSDTGGTVVVTESINGINNMDSNVDTGSVPSKQSETQPKTLLQGLLENKNKKQSMALTRIKKRKRPSEEEGANTIHEDNDEGYNDPPLKRAKLRTGAEGGKVEPVFVSKPKMKEHKKNPVSTQAKTKTSTKELDTLRKYPLRSPKVKSEVMSPTKTPSRRGQHQRNIIWPTVKKPNFDKYVSCDLCEYWYHIGCVGVESHDVRLRPTEIYTCPICQVGKDASPAKNENRDADAASECHRPDCIYKQKKKRKSQVVIEPQQLFVVEAFVGRSKKYVGGIGIQMQYLVKWHDYDFSEATWESLENMGLSDPGPLLDAFEKEAKAQRIDLDGEVIVLQEAADAGWNKKVFVKRE